MVLNMKTEAQLARTELELNAIDAAYAMMRHLGYRPGHDTWKAYCQRLSYKLSDALSTNEYRQSLRPIF